MTDIVAKEIIKLLRGESTPEKINAILSVWEKIISGVKLEIKIKS